MIFTAFLTGMGFEGNLLVDRFSVLSDETKEETGRLQIWRDTWLLVEQFPILGTGLGAFSYAYPQVKSINVQAKYYHAHNDYLELLTETGLVGFLILISLLGYLFIRLVKRVIRGREPWGVAMGIAGIAAVCAVFCHSIADFNMHIPANVALFSVVLGITYNL